MRPAQAARDERSRLTMPARLIEGIKVAKNRLSLSVNKEFKRKYLKSDFFAEYEPDIHLEQFDYSVLSYLLL